MAACQLAFYFAMVQALAAQPTQRYLMLLEQRLVQQAARRLTCQTFKGGFCVAGITRLDVIQIQQAVQRKTRAAQPVTMLEACKLRLLQATVIFLGIPTAVGRVQMQLLTTGQDQMADLVTLSQDPLTVQIRRHQQYLTLAAMRLDQ